MSMYFPAAPGNFNLGSPPFYPPPLFPRFGHPYNPCCPSHCPPRPAPAPIPRPVHSPMTNGPSPFVSMPNEKPSLNLSSSSTWKSSERNLSHSNEQNPTISGLNPFAAEFSIGMNSNDQRQMINAKETIASYRSIINELIDKSLQSIEAIERVSKVKSTHHVSTQCDRMSHNIHRSTQTTMENEKQSVLEDFSACSIRLMDRMMEEFHAIIFTPPEKDFFPDYQRVIETGNELRQLLLLIDQLLTRTDRSKPIIYPVEGRGRRMVSSSSSSLKDFHCNSPFFNE